MKFKTLLLIASLVLTNSAFSKNQIQTQITFNRIPYTDGTKVQWEKTCELKDYEGCKNKIYKNRFAEYKKGCESGDQKACSSLGTLYAAGLGVEKDYAKAKQLHEDACNKGEPVGCFNLAVLYEKGLGVEQDYAKAEKEYKKFCNMGHDVGCKYLKELRAKLK